MCNSAHAPSGRQVLLSAGLVLSDNSRRRSQTPKECALRRPQWRAVHRTLTIEAKCKKPSGVTCPIKVLGCEISSDQERNQQCPPHETEKSVSSGPGTLTPPVPKKRSPSPRDVIGSTLTSRETLQQNDPPKLDRPIGLLCGMYNRDGQKPVRRARLSKPRSN